MIKIIINGINVNSVYVYDGNNLLNIYYNNSFFINLCKYNVYKLLVISYDNSYLIPIFINDDVINVYLNNVNKRIYLTDNYYIGLPIMKGEIILNG